MMAFSFCLLMTFVTSYGHELKTKIFNVLANSRQQDLMACIVSCMENDCGAVSMTDGKCAEFSRQEWHPELNLDASENVSFSVCVTF